MKVRCLTDNNFTELTYSFGPSGPMRRETAVATAGQTYTVVGILIGKLGSIAYVLVNPSAEPNLPSTLFSCCEAQHFEIVDASTSGSWQLTASPPKDSWRGFECYLSIGPVNAGSLPSLLRLIDTNDVEPDQIARLNSEGK